MLRLSLAILFTWTLYSCSSCETAVSLNENEPEPKTTAFPSREAWLAYENKIILQTGKKPIKEALGDLNQLSWDNPGGPGLPYSLHVYVCESNKMHSHIVLSSAEWGKTIVGVEVSVGDGIDVSPQGKLILKDRFSNHSIIGIATSCLGRNPRVRSWCSFKEDQALPTRH